MQRFQAPRVPEAETVALERKLQRRASRLRQLLESEAWKLDVEPFLQGWSDQATTAVMLRHKPEFDEFHKGGCALVAELELFIHQSITSYEEIQRKKAAPERTRDSGGTPFVRRF